jgi:hypothetical protein
MGRSPSKDQPYTNTAIKAGKDLLDPAVLAHDGKRRTPLKEQICIFTAVPQCPRQD